MALNEGREYFAIKYTYRKAQFFSLLLLRLKLSNLGKLFTFSCSHHPIQTQSIEQVQQLQQQQQQQQYCQCNTDWLQNQTSFWLNKWLDSPNSVSQIRALLSNSTDATQMKSYIGFSSKRDSNNPRQHHGGSKMTQNSSANHYWNAWNRNHSKASSTNSNNSQANRNIAQHSSRTSRRHSQQLQPSKLLMQGERGLPGPKVSESLICRLILV